METENSSEMTVADALTELKRIDKILEKRKENILRYSSKRKGSPDEIEKQKQFVASQFDSAKDLIERYKKIKIIINASNLETQLEFEGMKFTVASAILFKQRFYQMKKDLYDSFSPITGNRQVNEFARHISGLTEEQIDKLELVPELMYDEKEIIKLKEGLLSLYSFVDALIEKSNHNTFITI